MSLSAMRIYNRQWLDLMVPSLFSVYSGQGYEHVQMFGDDDCWYYVPAPVRDWYGIPPLTVTDLQDFSQAGSL